MAQTTNEIEAHLHNKREELGQNIRELERKVKHAADWKNHFETRPMAMMGAAFGGGLLLAVALSGRDQNRSPAYPVSPRTLVDEKVTEKAKVKSEITQKANDTWEDIKHALLGVASAHVTQFISEVIPGFNDEWRRVEERRSNRPHRSS